MIKKLAILFCCLPLGLCAQIRVLGGTSFTVLPGTNVTFQGPDTGTVKIDSAAAFVNNGTISLQPNTVLKEHTGFPITGNGYETLTKTIVLGTSAQDLNGTGLVLKGEAGTETITLHRWHQAVLNQVGNYSIKRLFKIETAGSSRYFSGLNYDTTELNAEDPTQLMLYASADSTNWINVGGNDSAYGIHFSDTLQHTSYLTAYAANVSVSAVNDSVLCAGDTVSVELVTNGLFNPNTAFILEYAVDSLFTSPAQADTVDASGGTLSWSAIPGLAAGEPIYLRVRAENPNLSPMNEGVISVFSYPVVSIMGLDPHYCSAQPVDSLTLSPTGGSLTGTGWTGSGFDPGMAGVGTHILQYSYTNAGGCSATTSDTTAVSANPVATLTSSQTIFCENDTAIALNGGPAGGVFSGTTGGNIFDPSVAGPGNFTVWYTLTDSLGCAGSDSVDMLVNALPAVPVISQSTDTLWSGVTADHYQWYLSGSPIAGSDAPFYVAHTGGDYTVEATNTEGCSSVSTIYTLIFTGISGLQQQAINVYPNPVMQGQYLYVSTKGQALKYVMYSAEGKVVLSGAPQNGMITLGDLSSGAYMLKLENYSGPVSTHKIVITQ